MASAILIAGFVVFGQRQMILCLAAVIIEDDLLILELRHNYAGAGASRNENTKLRRHELCRVATWVIRLAI